MADVSGWLVKNVASDEAIPSRVAKLLSFFVNGGDYMKEVFLSHCESGAMLADRLGFDEGVQKAVRYLWEQWDGKSAAYGLKGDETPVTSRLLHFAQVMEVAHRFGGKSYALEIAKERRGKDFDPDIVDMHVAASERSDYWAPFQMESAKDAVLDIRPPSPYEEMTEEHVENTCQVLADFIDIKSPFTWGHSRTVAETSEAVARQLGLDDAEITTLRRSALVHDLGKVMVPCSAMEKEDGFTLDETERIRLHAYYTDRVLSQVDALKDLAPTASAHHEACDGSGYHRQLTAEQTTLEQRILAVSDRFATLIKPGDHTPEEALAQIKAETGALVDPQCFVGLERYVEGRPSAAKATAAERPGNLSEREVEVIRHLAQGMRNKDVASALVISENTVERHLANIYNKLDVTSRTSAVVFGVQNGLVD
jgi:HD-GYP domain-containing protein (c-di-GMP phosphodiesterase class II)